MARSRHNEEKKNQEATSSRKNLADAPRRARFYSDATKIKPKTTSLPTHPEKALYSSTNDYIKKTLRQFPPLDILESFILVQPDVSPLYPPATLSQSVLVHLPPELSEKIKASLGVKSSSHAVDIVSIHTDGCDLILSPAFPNDANLNNLPGQGKACYLITPDKKLYYANKSQKKCTQISIAPEDFDALYGKLALNSPNLIDKIDSGSFTCLLENLNTEQLQHISALTLHVHAMGFYKKNAVDSVMSPIEAVNSTAYQLLGPRHFPTCYAIRNPSHRYIGVYSQLLPGFKPNRDDPLQKQDLEISALKNMIKKRDEHGIENLKQVFETIKKIIPLLKREVDPNNSYIYQFWEYTKNTTQYYMSNANSSYNVKPKFEEFVKQNVPTITFEKLDSMRQLLVNRKANIEQTITSVVATQHDHEKELSLLESAIAQLNLIILDDVALFIKNLHRISRSLYEAWVDVEVEKDNVNSKYANIQIVDGLVAPLRVSLEDIYHYQVHVGQATGLTARYFMRDPDGHARNKDKKGRNVDGDLGDLPLTYRFNCPDRKPGPNDFILDPIDYIKFPNFILAKFRYWPTKATILDTSADTALSAVSDKTKNYFTTQDNQNYQSLEFSPVFDFQKYVQLIIQALTNNAMYTACAKLHMTDQLAMLPDDGNVMAPLPLVDSHNQRQDVQQAWINSRTNRSLEAKELAFERELLPLKNILEHHSDLMLELVQYNFQIFIEDRKMELNPESVHLLEEEIQPAAIAKAFHLLKDEILSTTHEKQITEKRSPSVLAH